MTEPLLATKFFVPFTRPELISRSRLLEQLTAGFHRKLTLVSAPAGFGKSTLVSDWIDKVKSGLIKSDSSRSRFAWLSLDEADNHERRFLQYFVTGLAQLEGVQLQEVVNLVELPQPVSSEVILTTLINALSTMPDTVVYVLDDYHLITEPSIHETMNFLVNHLPPQLHLVILTREDPPLPVSRLRARGELSELRAADLRFRDEEITAFLNQEMGVELSAEDMNSLETRTEGWITGLQLFALSAQGQENASELVAAFTGDNRYIVDYLVEEVLRRLPEDLRQFLLQTSILDRLTGSLCAAVTGNLNSNTLLEKLDNDNLFVIPLDHQREWFRYHHLFADVLQAHLAVEMGDQVSDLHQRASQWYEKAGFTESAIQHALRAKDFEQAAALIELAWPAMDVRFLSSAWLRWAQMLPVAFVQKSPVLAVDTAWALLSEGDIEGGQQFLGVAERLLDGKRTDMVIVDQRQFQMLPPSMASAHAFMAQALGNVQKSIEYGQRALELLPPEDYLRRGPAAGVLALAYWGNGDLDKAYSMFAETMAGFQKVESYSFAISITYGLADIRMVQGRLRDAVNLYEESLKLVSSQGKKVLRGTADLYMGLGNLSLERGNLEEAQQFFQKSEELGASLALQDWPYRFHIARARYYEVVGDYETALQMLSEAERLYFPTPVPNVQPVGALKAGLWVKSGKLHQAVEWVREQRLSIDDELCFLCEFDHMMLARIRIAEYKAGGSTAPDIQDVHGLLARLRDEALSGGRIGSLIEILILQALAFEAQNNLISAVEVLEQALKLAAPEGYVRIFVNEGATMARLLAKVLSDGVETEYTAKLLSAFRDGPTDVEGSSTGQGELIEPLTEREIEVLGLIAGGLTNQEIAEQLFLSIHTVKIHARNIYMKLGVNNRTKAAALGKVLGYLPD